MLQALKEARKALEDDEVPIGAVVVMNGKIIAPGHAEIIALTSAFNFLGSKYLPDASIYITLEPCLMCAGALYWSKIGRVVYGADDEKNGHRKFIIPVPAIEVAGVAPWPFHPKTELVKGVLKDECAMLLKEFFRSKR